MRCCRARPAAVIAMNWPRRSMGQTSRTTSPARVSRSVRRDVLYCGSSIAFSSSTGRIRPFAARNSSMRASYQASGGKPSALRSASTAASTCCCTRTRRAQAATVWGEGGRGTAPILSDSCNCINLDSDRTGLYGRSAVSHCQPKRRFVMKLYFSPGACSLSPHIVLRAKKTKDGADFLQVNPKGQVPVLALDDGDRLTEGPAIVQYIADKAPGSGLVPPAGSKER